MSKLFLRWFGGMRPRLGDQHLVDRRMEETGFFRGPSGNPDFEVNEGVQATEAENCNLYSGELRPLKEPALAHQFCKPTDECWRQPLPDDPSVPPVPPPEPPACIPVNPLIGDYCLVYDCSAYHDAILASSGVVWYYPMNRQSDIDQYPTPASITDYSIYANHTLNSQAAWSVQAVDDPSSSGFDNCSGKVSLFQDAPSGGSSTSVFLRNVGGVDDNINEYPLSTEWTYLVHHPNDYTNSQAIIGEFKYRNPSNATIGQGTITRLDATTMRIYFAVPGAGSQLDYDIGTNYPNWRNSVVGFRITYNSSSNETDMELLVDFAPTGVFAPTRTGRIAGTGGDEILSHTGYFSQSEVQESTLWNRALSDVELLALKGEWDRNKATYVDPDPNCGGIPITDNGVTYPTDRNTPLVLSITINSDATAPVQYQWFQDGVVLPGEVGPTLTMSLQFEDANTFITVLVQNPCSSYLSAPYMIGDITSEVTTITMLTDIEQYTGYANAYNGWLDFDDAYTGLAVNYKGWGSMWYTSDHGDTWTIQNVARSYNGGYPIQNVMYYKGRWWQIVYRAEQRSNGWDYNDNDWTTGSIWWNGLSNNQDFNFAYNHGLAKPRNGRTDDNLYHYDGENLYDREPKPKFVEANPAKWDGPRDVHETDSVDGSYRIYNPGSNFRPGDPSIWQTWEANDGKVYCMWNGQGNTAWCSIGWYTLANPNSIAGTDQGYIQNPVDTYGKNGLTSIRSGFATDHGTYILQLRDHAGVDFRGVGGLRTDIYEVYRISYANNCALPWTILELDFKTGGDTLGKFTMGHHPAFGYLAVAVSSDGFTLHLLKSADGGSSWRKMPDQTLTDRCQGTTQSRSQLLYNPVHGYWVFYNNDNVGATHEPRLYKISGLGSL